MILLEEGVQQQSTLGKRNQKDKQANVSSDYGKQLRRAQLLTLDVQMVISSTVFAVDFLSSNDLGSHTVSVVELVFAITGLDVFGVDSQKLEILALVVEVLLKTLEKWRKESFRQSFDHIIGINNEDWPWSLAEITDLLLKISIKDILLELLLLTHLAFGPHLDHVPILVNDVWLYALGSFDDLRTILCLDHFLALFLFMVFILIGFWWNVGDNERIV